MKSIIFVYVDWIIALAILSFFLGFAAHGLKQMASSLATGSQNGSSENGDRDPGDTATA